MIWPFTRRKPDAALTRRVEAAEVRAEAADKVARIARLEVAEQRNKLRELAEFTQAQTRLVLELVRRVDYLQADNTSGVTNAALDRRLLNIEALLMAPISDAGVNEQAQAALEDALIGLSKGSA